MGKLQEWRKYLNSQIKDIEKRKEKETPLKERIEEVKIGPVEKDIEDKTVLSKKDKILEEISIGPERTLNFPIVDPAQILAQKDKKAHIEPRKEILTQVGDPLDMLMRKDKKSAITLEDEIILDEKIEPKQDELPLLLPVDKTQRLNKVYLEERKRIIEKLLDPEITLNEASILLNISKATLRRYTDRKLISYMRTGAGQRKFKLSHLLEFQEKREKLNLDKYTEEENSGVEESNEFEEIYQE